MSIVVSDTTPLNYLILIGHAGILPELFGRILVPPAVIQEMRHEKAPSAVAAWVQDLPEWLEVRAPALDLHLDIGPGEDEAISLAVEVGNAALLVDDKKARTAAIQQGLPTFGTLTLLDLADEAGLLDFESAILKLQTTSFRAERTLVEAILRKVRSR